MCSSDLVAKSGHWGAGQAPRPLRLASLGVTGFRPCPSGPLAACPACHRRRLVPSGQVPLLAEASWPLTWRSHGSAHLPRDPAFAIAPPKLDFRAGFAPGLFRSLPWPTLRQASSVRLSRVPGEPLGPDFPMLPRAMPWIFGVDIFLSDQAFPPIFPGHFVPLDRKSVV